MKFIKRLNIFLNKPKVFCIGMNKTGTSTMTKIFKELNFRVAPQIKQEKKIGEIKSQNEILTKLKQLKNKTVIFITHDSKIKKHCDEIYLLKNNTLKKLINENSI